MEKRTLFAFALSALILMLYFRFQAPAPHPTQKQTVAESQPSATESAQAAGPTRPSVPLPAEETKTYQNDLYEVEVSNHNASIQSWKIKSYRANIDQNQPIDLFENVSSQNFGFRLISPQIVLPEVIPYEMKTFENHRAEYRWESDALALEKKIEWNPNQYTATISFTLENRSGQPQWVSVGLGLENHQPVIKKDTWSFLKRPAAPKHPILFNQEGVVRKTDTEKMSAENLEKGAFRWIGLEDHYFLWSILPKFSSSDIQVRYGKKQNDLLYSELYYPSEALATGGKLTKEFTVYVGPKEIDRLKSLNASLEEAIDYGWFGWLSRPILWLLQVFHSILANWGLSIIALTLFIKLILYPINKKTMQSMKAMQALQPRLKELREKYQNDRQRLNAEMMELFRTHKVNPAGGCLPMLLQMPIYIALYKVLYNAVELYQAPFFGFYRDLSAPDPYFIAPILLCILMVLQQRLTPTPNQDPAQAKMMMLMPILFSAFMLFLPVGLVVYIFVNTLITLLEHYHRLSKDRALQTIK